MVSRAPYTKILPFKARMGWTVPWYSSYGNDFNHDFQVSFEGHDSSAGGQSHDPYERPGLSCFLRDRERIFHTYSTYERGLDGLGSTTSLLDLTALGRQEEWEQPEGRASALGAPAGSERDPLPRRVRGLNARQRESSRTVRAREVLHNP